MRDHDPDEKRRQKAPAGESTVRPQRCDCGCQPEPVHVAELHQDHARILPELSQLGELICFARNRHCILGASLCMPDLQGESGYFTGGDQNMDLHLDTTMWRYAYTVHEQHQNRGLFIGLEFFDDQHRALFRTFLTPDSESQDYQMLIQRFYRRYVPFEEMSAWHRMGELTSPSAAGQMPISDNFVERDIWSAPLASWLNEQSSTEMGFCGSLPLVFAVLLDASEEKQELTLTTAGGFGRMALPFIPEIVEQSKHGWMYAGSLGRALRLNTSAVSTYWIGSYNSGHESYSYLEVVDAYGDLILRITKIRLSLINDLDQSQSFI